jgi:hypothetical protein
MSHPSFREFIREMIAAGHLASHGGKILGSKDLDQLSDEQLGKIVFHDIAIRKPLLRHAFIRWLREMFKL